MPQYYTGLEITVVWDVIPFSVVDRYRRNIPDDSDFLSDRSENLKRHIIQLFLLI
jgi:hypothetical protein